MQVVGVDGIYCVADLVFGQLGTVVLAPSGNRYVFGQAAGIVSRRLL